MTDTGFPLLIEPDQLDKLSDGENVLIVDLCSVENYIKYHIPGAVHLDYGRIVAGHRPVMGLIPDSESLSTTLGATGITPDTWVIAYDDEGGGRSGRLAWTLEIVGHRRFSCVNGGLIAWINEGHRVSNQPVTPKPATNYPIAWDDSPIALRTYILEHLGDPGTCLLDTRSQGEYTGEKKLAQRGGHIPGAVHFEWTDAMDKNNFFKLRTEDELRSSLAACGATPDKEIIAYCQTHHRSSHTWLALKHLGYERVKGYPGAWSDWGNQPDIPVE